MNLNDMDMYQQLMSSYQQGKSIKDCPLACDVGDNMLFKNNEAESKGSRHGGWINQKDFSGAAVKHYYNLFLHT